MYEVSLVPTNPQHSPLSLLRFTQDTADAAPDTLLQADPQAVVNSSHSAARQLGLHYLKRYFLLIAYRCVALSTKVPSLM